MTPRGWFAEVRYAPGWWVQPCSTEAEAEAWSQRQLALDPLALVARVRPMPPRTRCGPPRSTPVELRLV